jgi:putative addiction module component (TIGR02574 family)
MQLSPHERSVLAQHLLSSIVSDDAHTAESEWFDEAERRLKAYQQNRISAEPVEEVFEDLFAELL